jgi:hypothetical protein
MSPSREYCHGVIADVKPYSSLIFTKFHHLILGIAFLWRSLHDAAASRRHFPGADPAQHLSTGSQAACGLPWIDVSPTANGLAPSPPLPQGCLGFFTGSTGHEVSVLRFGPVCRE